MEFTSCRHSCMCILWFFYPSAEKKPILIMLFTMLLGPTARASDSMFYPLTLCALQIDFMIMIMIQMCWANWPLHLFSVIFYCLAMRFCGCPYKHYSMNSSAFRCKSFSMQVKYRIPEKLLFRMWGRPLNLWAVFGGTV